VLPVADEACCAGTWLYLFCGPATIKQTRQPPLPSFDCLYYCRNTAANENQALSCYGGNPTKPPALAPCASFSGAPAGLLVSPGLFSRVCHPDPSRMWPLLFLSWVSLGGPERCRVSGPALELNGQLHAASTAICDGSGRCLGCTGLGRMKPRASAHGTLDRRDFGLYRTCLGGEGLENFLAT